MPNVGDELHHFGWNACSSALCPWAPHPHVERRYLLVPGLRSSRIHVVDVKDDPRAPKLVKVIEAEEIAAQGRLQPPAHDPLRARRHLRLRARQPRGRRPGRDLPARPRRLLRQGRVGGRPRPAGARLRLLVAPRLRHRDHQRVGHAEDGRGRPRRRAAARQQVRPQAARLGPREAPPPAGDRPRPRAPDGARAAPRARSVARPTASSASSTSTADLSASVWLWSAPTTAPSAREGDHDPGRAGRGRPAPARSSSRSAPCRR